MPAYGYLQWGDCGTIINPQMTVDYLTTSADNLDPTYPLSVTLIDENPCSPAYTPATSASGYLAPHLDPAPWYDPSYGDDPTTNPSAQFLGVIISSVEGLDSTLERSMETRAVGVGGGSFGPQRALQRELVFRGVMYATTCRGMEYGMRWFTDTLKSQGCSTDGLSTLEIWTGCPESGAGMDQDSRWQFPDTSLMSGPTYTDGPWEYRACHIREVEWTIGSESPYRQNCPIDKVATSAMNVAPSGEVDICTWLSDSQRVSVRATPTARVGEDFLNIELVAGNRPLNCDINAWAGPFAKDHCYSFSTPRLRSRAFPLVTNYSWVYEIQPDGAWIRYEMDDTGNYVGFPTAGTGVIRGVDSAGEVDDVDIFRDIKIIATSVAPSAYTSKVENGLIYAEAFRNCVLIGADLDISYAVDGTTSSGDLRSTRHRAVRLKNFTGTAHVEGVRIHGSTVYGGIEAGSKFEGAKLHLRNVLIEDVKVSGADGGYPVRIRDGLYSFEVDGLTVLRTAKYGIYIRPTDALDGGDGLLQEATIRRFNATSSVASGSSRTMLYVGAPASGERRPPVRLFDCWSGYDGGDSAIAIAATSAGTIAWSSATDNYFRDYIYWPTSAEVYGVFYREDPDADFVTAGQTGAAFSDFDGALGLSCANFIVRDLPIGYRLVIDSGTELIRVYDRAGIQRDGSPYVSTDLDTGYAWLQFNKNSMCVLVSQKHAYDGDGSMVRVTQTHRSL